MAVSHDFGNVSYVSIAFSRIAASVQDLATRYQTWKAEKQTREELMRLTDAELADIGLSRHQIHSLDLSKNA